MLARVAEAQDAKTAVARTFELIAATLQNRQDLLRLMQYCSLELGDDIDPLLRRHLGELVEVIARYLDPWVRKGELRCPSAKTLVLSLVAIILSHRSLHLSLIHISSSTPTKFDSKPGNCRSSRM